MAEFRTLSKHLPAGNENHQNIHYGSKWSPGHPANYYRQRSACTGYFYQPAMTVTRWTDDWQREMKNLGPHVLPENETLPLKDCDETRTPSIVNCTVVTICTA